jgi:hypothetical protein
MLLEAVLDRSEVSSIAVVDSRGLVVSGAGVERELAILGAVAQPAAEGAFSYACESLTLGTDVLARPLHIPGVELYLAALGTRVSRMHEAARSIERIFANVA